MELNGHVVDDNGIVSGHAGRALCGAKRRQKDGTCGKPAGWGTSHVGYGTCRLHGGNTPNQVAGATRRQVETEARRALADFRPGPVTNPLQALGEHAAIVTELRDYLRDQVARLENLRYQAGAGEQLRAELAAYQSALRDTTAVLSAYARLNIDARLAKITEDQAEIVVHALKAGLRAAGVLEASESGRAAHSAMANALRAHRAEGPRVIEASPVQHD